jgi:excisionase family DNA binding protein
VKTKTTTDRTPREAAQRLKVELGYVYHLLWSGRLPGVQRNGRWLIPEAAIAEREKGRSR